MTGSSVAKLELVVVAATELAKGIRGFELRAEGGGELPAFQCGDHVDVVTPAGHLRQYSLHNASSERHRWCIAVKRELASRGGSASMHADVRVGTRLTVSAPRSNFALQTCSSALLLAGGIGVTPLLSMMYRLESLGVPTRFEYFFSSAADAAFLDELASQRQHVRVVLRPGLAPAEVSEALRAAAAGCIPDTQAYVCGPGPFMAAAQEALVPKLGENAVHFEFFKPREDAAAPTTGCAFRVRLARSGREFEVAPGQTILAALSHNGVTVPTSCQQGICGTCVTKVLSGTPEHRDSFLNEFNRKANKKIAICVSRCSSEVLELDL